MIRTAIGLCLLGLPLLLISPRPASSAQELYILGNPGSALPCLNPIAQEPVVNYDVSGGTLTGPIHVRLTVYSSGLATASSASGFPGSPFGEPTSQAATAYASQADVAMLQKRLRDANALRLCDQLIAVSDVPLTTVTVFRGASNAFAHSFSYWLGIDDYGEVNSAIGDFMAKYFPQY